MSPPLATKQNKTKHLSPEARVYLSGEHLSQINEALVSFHFPSTIKRKKKSTSVAVPLDLGSQTES
jgi:Na+/serine symporter